MGDFPKLLIFGSFTEDETRTFQKKYVDADTSSPRTTHVQFGSLDFNTVLSLRNLKEAKGADFSQRSNNSSSSSSITKDDAPKRRNAPKPVNAKEVSISQTNGNADKCLPSPKSSENGKLGMNLSSLCISDENRAPNALTRDADIDSSKDVTESSSESEFYLSSPVTLSSSEEFPKKNAHNYLNGGTMTAKPLLPCGLINPGNLCFLNATLQALLSCSPFVQLLQDLRASDVPKAVYPTVHAFVEFIVNFDMPSDLITKMSEQLITDTRASFLPSMFETVLKNFTPDLPSNIANRPRQEDAQEFLCFVLDRLHDELLKLDGYRSDFSGGLSSLVSSQEDDGWETVGPKNKSAVMRTQSFMPSKLSDIFGGQIRSVVKVIGNKDSVTVQPFLLLHLNIFPDAVYTIQDALHLFSAPETLEGYKTSGGKVGVVSASKSVKILKLSKILILHLMRFSYGSRGSAKLHKPVHFPLEFVVDRKLLAAPSPESRKYELVATITHHGRDPSKGHYTADARYSNGKWLRYDDASVTAVPTSKVLHDQAYVLFYKQV